MQYRCAKFIATRYLQSAGERNVTLKEEEMKKLLLSLLISSTIGCAPAYLAPQNSPTATVNMSHTGMHPSNTTIDVFSQPKCEKQFFLGELGDIGTNIDLKKSATGKIEANKIVYFSGSRRWPIANAGLIASCSTMFSFTPKQNATYSMSIKGTDYGICSVDVFDESNKEKPSDLTMYKVDRICVGDAVHYEK